MIRTSPGLLVVLRVGAIATAALAAGCSSPTSRVAPAAPRVEVRTPPPPLAEERVTRYYVDETGAVWDDRGRKVGVAP